MLDYRPGRVETTRGTVTCDRLVIATEGYGATLRATHRRVLPLYSLMIATEPLPDAFWDEIGIAHGQTFADFRHLVIYGQRTADNRFAFGGRGARYHWGSAIRPGYDRVPRVFEHLRRTLGRPVPARRGMPRSPTAGAARSACPATGTRRRRTTRRRASRGRAATSATACRRRTSPGARSPTC